MRWSKSPGIEEQRRWNGELHKQQLIKASVIPVVQDYLKIAIIRERCILAMMTAVDCSDDGKDARRCDQVEKRN